jgi:hypothetical protein
LARDEEHGSWPDMGGAGTAGATSDWLGTVGRSRLGELPPRGPAIRGSGGATELADETGE